MKIITISGASGSGKSTLAAHLEMKLEGSLLLSLDRYYLSKKEQVEKNGYFNFDDPASLDVGLLKNHLAILSERGKAEVPIYDFTISERAGYETVYATTAIIVDGLFPGALLKEEADLDIFVDVDLDKALERRIERDIAERGRSLESVMEQFENQVRPAYFDFIEPLKKSADYIFENNTSIDEFLKDTTKILKSAD